MTAYDIFIITCGVLAIAFLVWAIIEALPDGDDGEGEPPTASYVSGDWHWPDDWHWPTRHPDREGQAE